MSDPRILDIDELKELVEGMWKKWEGREHLEDLDMWVERDMIFSMRAVLEEH